MGKGYRVGAVCSFLIGALYVLLIIYVVAIPSGQRYDPGQFFVHYAQRALSMSVAWMVMAATSILVLVVIPAVSDLVRPVSREWTRVAAVLGSAGSAVSAASFLTMLGAAPGLAQAYVAGDSATKAAIVAVGLPQLDPLNILVLGGPGVWYLVVNVLALRGGRLPRLQAIIGLGLAVGMALAVLAAALHSEVLDQVAAGAGAVLAPTWYVWMGVRLLRTAAC